MNPVTRPHYNAIAQGATTSLEFQEEEEENGIVTETTLSPTNLVVITVEDAIEHLGMGSFQYMILIAAGLCFAADAMEIVLLSFLSVVLQAEWQLTPNETASITSVMFFGACLGTLTLGPLADRWGRQPVFRCTAWIISLASLVSGLMSQYHWLLVVIFIIGFGIGGLTVPFDILAEFLPSAKRGSNLLMIEYCWTLGVLFVVFLAQQTLSTGNHDNNNNNNWRALVLGCAAVCCGSALLGTCLVPESPRWLVTQGRSNEALHILRRAAVQNGLVYDHNANLDQHHLHDDEDEDDNDNNDTTDDINHVLHPLHVLFLPNVQLRESYATPSLSTEHSSHKDSSFADLFQPRWRRITLLLWGTWAAFAFGYYGSIQAMTRVFAHEDTDGGGDVRQLLTTVTRTSLHHSSNHTAAFYRNHTMANASTSSSSSSYHFDYQALWISSSAEFVGTTLAILSVDRFGRIPFQMLSYATAGVAICLLCVVAQQSSHPSSILGSWLSSSSSSFNYRRWTLIGLGFITRVFEMSATCVTWVSTAEILTTEVRTTGHAAANAVARLGALLSPFLIEGSSRSLSLWQIGVVMLLVHSFAVLCVSQLPETKGQRLGHSDGEEVIPTMESSSPATTITTLTHHHNHHQQQPASNGLFQHHGGCDEHENDMEDEREQTQVIV